MATRIGCWVEGWIRALKKIIFSRKKYLHYVLLMIISRWWLVIKNFAAKAAKKIFVQLVLTVGHVLGMISLSISTNKSKVLTTNDQSTMGLEETMQYSLSTWLSLLCENSKFVQEMLAGFKEMERLTKNFPRSGDQFYLKPRKY